MADEEHVKILKKGVAEWNAWRSSVSTIRPDLSGADLTTADRNLIGANLSNAKLTGANLNNAFLTDAKLAEADLSGANLLLAFLGGANLSNANLTGANLSGAMPYRANLSGANMSNSNLSNAKLTEADLSGANLYRANLTDAYLSGANLSGANLGTANLNGANLTGAKLTDADLTFASLNKASLSGDALLSGAKLTVAKLFETVFVNVDLTSVIGLETCIHLGPSVIDHRTLERSGRLPLSFLRGVGLPDSFIEYLPSLFNRAIQHYSCFISYSTKDQEFAERLHADLQNKGVRCWFAPHDLRIGDKILDEIDAVIRLRDKILLILSEHSIQSDWVEDEVTAGFEEERKRGQIVLFPVRLDEIILYPL